MTPPENTPALEVKRDDPRAAGYEKIVSFHNQILEAKWRAKTAGQQLALGPQDVTNVAMHCEQAVAFLAEEMLRLSVAFEQANQEKSGNAQM